MDRIHPALLPESRPCVSQSATKHCNRVIHSTRIAMQDLLCNKCPAVYLFCDVGRNGPPPLMGYVDMPWIPSTRLAGRNSERRDRNALVKK
jgi:hypothetical protein